ncbi:MAG: transcriptional regulator [Gordonia sp.]|nr:transcriptional regulator [Gordonia sp. (in: high G+C Gram-positive bacteria)]
MRQSVDHENPALPQLGTFVAQRRRARSLTQSDLARVTGYSNTYVSHIEQGQQKRPSKDVLDQLSNALQLNPTDARHLYRLAGLSPAAPTAPSGGITRDDIDYVDMLSPHLAAILDSKWNVLHANTDYYRIYRGLETVGNVLYWFFLAPDSRRIMLEWEAEARLTIGWLRHLMVMHPGEYDEVLTKCSVSTQFRAYWSDQQVFEGRQTSQMLVRDLDHDVDLTLTAQVWPDPTRLNLQLYLGITGKAAPQ